MKKKVPTKTFDSAVAQIIYHVISDEIESDKLKAELVRQGCVVVSQMDQNTIIYITEKKKQVAEPGNLVFIEPEDLPLSRREIERQAKS